QASSAICMASDELSLHRKCRLRSRVRRLRVGPQPQQVGAYRYQQQADTLCGGEAAAPEHRVNFMAAQKLHEEPRCAIEHQVPAEDLAVELLLAILRIEKNKNREFGGSFIELRRMQRNIERDAHSLVAVRVCEGDGPRQRARQSPAAAGGKTAETSEAVAD